MSESGDGVAMGTDTASFSLARAVVGQHRLGPHRGSVIGRAAAVVVLVASLVAGCANSSDDSSDGSPSTTTASVDVTLVSPTTQPATTLPATTTTDPFVAVATVAGLAAELSLVEAGIREPAASAATLVELGRRQQLAYRAVNRHPEWHEELLELVDPVALVPLQFHLAVRQASIDHAAGRPPAEPVTTLPAWTIVEPLPADELLGYYREAEAITGVPWQYLAAIHFQETRMGRIVGVSSAGAVGPMQFLPSTWAGCCEGDPTVARDAILGAARYLVLRGAPADMQAALYGYNPNDAYVGSVMAYAANILADERAYLGYHGWQVFVGTAEGTVRLPVGYAATEAVDVVAYLRDRPDDLLPDV